jgi:protein-S-isoprenylcysteine O-methyltransferase Ste14
MIGYIFLWITILPILGSVLLKFLQHKKITAPMIAKEQKHSVATLSMAVVVACIFPFIANRIGILDVSDNTLVYLYFAFGLFFMVFGCFWHLWAKLSLGKFWSDTIKTHKKHNIVENGAYHLSRHPMYGSLFLWMIGASFVTINWAALLITFFIFLPMIIFRAKAEESLLIQSNPEYVFYQNNVRMLLPSLGGVLAIWIKVAIVVILGYFIYVGITFSALVFLSIIHILLGYSLLPEKVAFSYRSKTGMMIFVWILSYIWAPFYYFYYLIFFMFVYGLVFTCPCMYVYNKFGHCPCFSVLGKICTLKRK